MRRSPQLLPNLRGKRLYENHVKAALSLIEAVVPRAISSMKNTGHED